MKATGKLEETPDRYDSWRKGHMSKDRKMADYDKEIVDRAGKANLKMWGVLAIIFFSLNLINNFVEVLPNPLVPCYFIFGDSLSDAGNNNGLLTKAKTNYIPYGIDYPESQPTGRFTNGRTAVDIIAEHLGFEEHIAPYSTANKDQMLKGVNYASGAAGINPESGSHLGARISLDVQIRHHKNIITELNFTLNHTTHDYLQKCLYTINIGSNDYINNYFTPKFYSTSRKYSPRHFASLLVKEYSRQIETLHEYGARKIAVFGLGPIGCTIAEVAKYPFSLICVRKINKAVSMFNKRLKKLVPHLNRQFPNAKFTFINTEAVIVGPLEGVCILNKPCCKLREDFQCEESVAPCENRRSYYFFDGFHPTEAVNKISGARAFKALTPFDAFPYDISRLVKL